MTNYVRIKDPASGHEYTYDDAKVEALGLAKHVVDKDPFGPDGRPAPVKYRMPLGEPLPGSAADRRRKKDSDAAPDGDSHGQSADTTKEK